MRLGMKLFLLPEYHHLRTRALREARIGPRDRILDFGCGVGLLEGFLVKKISAGGTVIGADIGENLLRRAQGAFPQPNVAFCRIDPAGRLPFQSGRFDLIITNLV